MFLNNVYLKYIFRPFPNLKKKIVNRLIPK